MSPIDIKCMLAKRGVSQTDIASRLGVILVAFHRVINGESASRRIADHIAEVLELSTDQLWSGRYGRNLRRTALLWHTTSDADPL